MSFGQAVMRRRSEGWDNGFEMRPSGRTVRWNVMAVVNSFVVLSVNVASYDSFLCVCDAVR